MALQILIRTRILFFDHFVNQAEGLKFHGGDANVPANIRGDLADSFRPVFLEGVGRGKNRCPDFIRGREAILCDWGLDQIEFHRASSAFQRQRSGSVAVPSPELSTTFLESGRIH